MMFTQIIFDMLDVCDFLLLFFICIDRFCFNHFVLVSSKLLHIIMMNTLLKYMNLTNTCNLTS